MDLPDDIIALILSNLTFEELLLKRQDPALRDATESPILLHLLSKIHSLPPRDAFLELLEEYDRRELTPRCLCYHPVGKCALHFAFIGDLEGVKRAEVKGWSNWNWVMVSAARGGHLDLVEYFIKKGADDWNWGMEGAAKGGHLHLVKYFTERGCGRETWDSVMTAAANGGHKNLVEYFVEQGANDWNMGMSGAAAGGHRDLVEFFVEQGANNWNWGIRSASIGGHLDLVKFFAEKGVGEYAWQDLLYIARDNGYSDIVEWLEENKP